MSCTLAVIAQLLGYTPAPGAVIAVPAATAAHYTPVEQRHARNCARRLGLRWRIVDGR